MNDETITELLNAINNLKISISSVLTLKDCAVYMGIDESEVLNQAIAYKIPYNTFNGVMYFDKDVIDSVLLGRGVWEYI